MRILAVDTSSQHGSVCVVDGQELIGEVRLASSMQHSERFFRVRRISLSAPSIPACGYRSVRRRRGPGSFTGLRVGLAAMNGFAAHRETGCRHNNTWRRWPGKREFGECTRGTNQLTPGEEKFTGLFIGVRKTLLLKSDSPVVLKPAEWFASLPRHPLIFCGDGAIRYRAEIETRGGWSCSPHGSVHGFDRSPNLAATPNRGPLAPLYVRKTDAEIARESIVGPSS